MPIGYTPQANKICDKSIGLHYANGRLHDTNGEKNKKRAHTEILIFEPD